jgi:hypothetical protein
LIVPLWEPLIEGIKGIIMGFWQDHKIRMKTFLDNLTNDAHIPIALVVFGSTFFYCAKTGKDLLPGFVSSLYAFYGFLGGHALVYQKWPDAASQTTVVNVDNDNTNNNSATANANAAPAAPAAAADSNAGTSGAKG